MQIKFFEPGVYIDSITINEKIPMHISLFRILGLFGIITFIYCVRNFEIFKKPFSDKNLKQEFILVGVLGVFLFLIWYINYNTSGNGYDFYCSSFVKAISHGSFSLEELPSDKLLAMNNPYDAQARDNAKVYRGTDYPWDTVLYNGKSYVYFGILPILILFLPFYLITGKFLLSSTRSSYIFNFISNSN